MIVLLCASLYLHAQVASKFQDGLDALESHPTVKRVTRHRKVTRTLKYIKGERRDFVINGAGDNLKCI